jgi:hypothetical protein
MQAATGAALKLANGVRSLRRCEKIDFGYVFHRIKH